MRGIQLFFLPGKPAEISVSPQALLHFRGNQAGNHFVTLLALLAHAYLENDRALSAVTPVQVAAETGLRLRDVYKSLRSLAQQGWFMAVTLPDGRPGYHIQLEETPGESL